MRYSALVERIAGEGADAWRTHHEARLARERGEDVILLSVGDPELDSPEPVTRCAIERLTQRRLGDAHSYRVEARGFCTQPAHAVRGDGEVLVSRFDFAGRVNYGSESAP